MPAPTRSLRALPVAAWAVAALTVLSGCSGAADAAAPAPSATPTLLATAELRLPVADYLVSHEDQLRISGASQALLQSCMKPYGFTVPSEDFSLKSGPVTITEMRYGVTSAEQAKLTGYHFGPANPGFHAPAPGSPDSTPANNDPDYLKVMRGNGTPGKNDGTAFSYHGIQVPAGGCTGEMTKKLTADATFFGDADLVKLINSQGFTQSMQDTDVQAVFKKWSACMLGHGYHYATPLDAVNDPAFAGKDPGPGEQQTAQADVACKQQENVVGVWFTVEANLERAAMAQHRGELRTIKAQMQQQAAVAADVLRSASASASATPGN